ncbi:MAG TPA: 3-hydroxyacyl-ACP dehydratase FabZ [Aquifex sp.]|uniref:3-hydroxyacyl-[acyl-carrier-protein] dehydratase FabZ n=1 Tax=Aquifex aeolicus TaxID=63363 RepID=A0A9D0YP56_AQUAO|nr:3-hydroxyacyl-ACP dehydratase FabZ [Aquifex sp.]HIP97948.1 3-hydroxyacyl-ACP dehydratase FabZ [Aquifex aeolicus]
MDINKIKEYLPHRYPFLLVDRILELDVPKRVVGLKNVTVNEPQFLGHFPQLPIFPGVLILEAMAQVGGILLIESLGLEIGKYAILYAGVDEARFKRPVVPGDTMVIEMESLVLKKKLSKMKGIVKVNGRVAAEAVIMASVVETQKIRG